MTEGEPTVFDQLQQAIEESGQSLTQLEKAFGVAVATLAGRVRQRVATVAWHRGARLVKVGGIAGGIAGIPAAGRTATVVDAAGPLFGNRE